MAYFIMYLTMIGLLIPSSIYMAYFDIKGKKLYLEFNKKLEDKGYKMTDDYDLVSLIAAEIYGRKKFAIRILLSLIPIYNLILIIKIITKKYDKECKTILNSLDNQEELDFLEKQKYIFNKNTKFKIKENIASKMDEINKIEEPSINSKHIEISENDSLNRLKQKKELLEEMIYLQNLKKMEPNSLSQESEEDKNLTEKEEQLSLIKTKSPQNEKK